jgi:cytochrome c peroxidase
LLELVSAPVLQRWDWWSRFRPGRARQAPLPLAALPLHADAPADNTSTPQKVALGRLLFWDPILSGAQDVACATCHHPDHGYSDSRDLPVGTGGKGLGAARTFQAGPTQLAKRNSPTIVNIGFSGIGTAPEYDPTTAPMFWDMRVRGLEAQALEPIETLEEMRGGGLAADQAVAAAVARVAQVSEYRDVFQRVFGGSQPVTAINLARAIAAFERSLVAPDTPFDRYMRGDHGAMTPAQVRGMVAFDNHGCTNCHKGPMLSDYTVHVLSVPDNDKLPGPDTGANNTYAFRTPSLRNLAYTGPYMHSGIFTSLETVLSHYQHVGGGGQGMHQIRRNTTINGFRILGFPVGPDDLDPLLKQVDVRSQRDEIIEFLQALNGDFDRAVPSRVPSGLRPGGNIE